MSLIEGAYLDQIFNQQSDVLVKKMLDAALVRQEALGANMANQNTAEYKRVDLSNDFRAQLRNLVKEGDMAGVAALEPTISVDTSAPVDTNGNSVDMETELRKGTENSIDYQFLAGSMTTSIRQIEMAIMGR